MKKRSASFHLDPDQLARLARLSQLTKAPQAAIVREGVDTAIAAWEARLVSQGTTLPPLETRGAAGGTAATPTAAE